MLPQSESYSNETDENFKEWLDLEKNEMILSSAKLLKHKADLGCSVAKAEIEDRFGKQIAFGTAGLRGRLSYGFSKMNNITVQLASQGVALYLEEVISGKEISVVIGYDHRYGSTQFATIAAKVFRLKGFKVYLFGKIVPTPFVPFAVQRLRADFGIMITASHNPKEDNGYKVYGSNGCQIRSPAEEHISAKIEKKNRRLWDISHELENVEDPFNFISEVYYENIKKLFCPKPSGIRIIYTPMHGVGKAYVDALFSSCEIPALDSVPRQAKPDPEFPSVKFPNPEEGKGALQPAMEYADSKSSRVIFANDPDADRFNVAEKNSNGSWRIFNGNEIALLLADYAWKRFGSTVNPERYVMIASLVSSRILAKMAAKEGFDFQQAATGFKNISNLGQELEAQGKKVLFAYEEAIGFMVGTTVWDKDGISALLAMYMIVSDLASQQLTISDHLESLYDRYGFPIQFNSYYYGGKAVGIMPELVKSLELVKNGQLFGDFEVESFEFQKSSKVVFLCFTNDTWLAIRASGTEPKVKFYSEMLVESKELVLKFQPSLEVAVKEVCELLLRPGLNNLTLKEE